MAENGFDKRGKNCTLYYVLNLQPNSEQGTWAVMSMPQTGNAVRIRSCSAAVTLETGKSECQPCFGGVVRCGKHRMNLDRPSAIGSCQTII